MISKCAFGIDTDATTNPDQELVKNGRGAFSSFVFRSWLDTILFAVPVNYFRFLLKLIDLFPPAYYNIWTISKDLMEQRRAAGIKGKDYIARLMELRDAVASDPHSEYHRGLNEDVVIAQAVIFFIAGFETTSNSMASLCYELARRPDLQETIVEEIESAMEGNDGDITHDTIDRMEFLEAVIIENLRKNPPITYIVRFCTKDCEVVPGLVVRKGTMIDMPILAAHYDEEYFEEPSEFRPERFLKENAAAVTPFTYRPFGGRFMKLPRKLYYVVDLFPI